MYEDRPEKDTPLGIRRQLAEYGGLSPDGQPKWRLVLASNCRIHCFGQRNIIGEGVRLSQIGDGQAGQDPGRVMRFVERVEDGEFWIPRYRCRGWILEHWFPAPLWGAKEAWEGQRARDGSTRLLAEWPARGAYRMLCGPWETIEAAGDLRAAIRQYNRQQQGMPRNVEAFLRAEAVIEMHEREQAIEDYAETLEDAQRLQVSQVLRSVSSSAQRWRSRVSAVSAGGVHLGASEKWG